LSEQIGARFTVTSDTTFTRDRLDVRSL
jgi:hypothetical protein